MACHATPWNATVADPRTAAHTGDQQQPLHESRLSRPAKFAVVVAVGAAVGILSFFATDSKVAHPGHDLGKATAKFMAIPIVPLPAHVSSDKAWVSDGPAMPTMNEQTQARPDIKQSNIAMMSEEASQMFKGHTEKGDAKILAKLEEQLAQKEEQSNELAMRLHSLQSQIQDLAKDGRKPQQNIGFKSTPIFGIFAGLASMAVAFSVVWVAVRKSSGHGQQGSESVLTSQLALTPLMSASHGGVPAMGERYHVTSPIAERPSTPQMSTSAVSPDDDDDSDDSLLESLDKALDDDDWSDDSLLESLDKALYGSDDWSDDPEMSEEENLYYRKLAKSERFPEKEPVIIIESCGDEPIDRAVDRFEQEEKFMGHMKVLWNRKEFENNHDKRKRKRKQSLMMKARTRRRQRMDRIVMSMGNDESTPEQAQPTLMKAFPPIMRSLKRAVDRTADITMAHHVQKKATKHHNHSRPRKSRPSDIHRKKPSYPELPDRPWMIPIKEEDGKTTVYINKDDLWMPPIKEANGKMIVYKNRDEYEQGEIWTPEQSKEFEKSVSISGMSKEDLRRVQQKTWMPSHDDRAKAGKKWYLVDAEGLRLGRMASEIAKILLGKNKVSFTPGVTIGDYVIVQNCEKVIVTGRKFDDKLYKRHSGRPGGMKIESFKDLQARIPERIVEKAVWGMLPKNSYGRELFRHLKVYKGSRHPHAAQQPEQITFTGRTAMKDTRKISLLFPQDHEFEDLDIPVAEGARVPAPVMNTNSPRANVTMKMPSINDAKDLTKEEIEKEILNAQKEMFGLRKAVKLRQPVKPHLFTHTKHRIAQLEFLLSQKEGK